MTIGFHLITNCKSSNQCIDEKWLACWDFLFAICRSCHKYVNEYVTMMNLQIGPYFTHSYLLNHFTITHANFSAAAIYYKRHYQQMRLNTLEKHIHTYYCTAEAVSINLKQFRLYAFINLEEMIMCNTKAFLF